MIQGGGSLTKVGSGTLTITGSNTYAGGTRVEQGTLVVEGSGLLGGGTVNVASGTSAFAFGGILTFGDGSSAGTLTITSAGGTIANAFGGLVTFAGSSSAGSATLLAQGGINGGRRGIISFEDSSSGGTARVELAGDGRLSITSHEAGTVSIGALSGQGVVLLGGNTLEVGGNAQSTVFSGGIQDSGALVKVGTGTLTLTGSSSFSGGTTIQAGTVLIGDPGAGASALGSGAVGVESGGKLAGVGTVLGDTLVAGTLTPGNSPGALHFAGDLMLQSSAAVIMELAGPGNHDEILVDGLLTFDGQLNVTLLGGFTPQVGETFDLFDAGSVAGGSHFDAVTFNVSGYDGTFDSATGVLTITAVPEPGTATLLVLAGSLLARRRRR